MNFHKHIYDLQKRKIIGDFDLAYNKYDNVWDTQRDLSELRFCYTVGFIHNLIKRSKKYKILDIGCGYGDFVNIFKNFKNFDAYGIDISGEAIKKGKLVYGKKLKTFKVDINKEKKSFNFKFDFITIFGVHWFILNNYRKTIKNIKNLSKKHTLFFITLNVPKNPIGKKIIKNYSDFYCLIKKDFKIIKCFKISNIYKTNDINKSNSHNIFMLCKLK